MVNRNPATRLLLAASAILALGTAGCGSGNKVPSATPQGTIPLESVKVGTPESVLQEAILTFVEDPKGAVGGKKQYLSRNNNADGGQYVVQCQNGKAFSVQIKYAPGSVPREVAVETMKQLFPPEVPPQSKVKEKFPQDFYWFGDEYGAAISYIDKSKQKVDWVSAWVKPGGSRATSPSETDAAGQSEKPESDG
ncbi:MAG TPA: hypothetical protein V6D08_14575 [Candidatus Obscuribacterales bacterium]